MTSADSVFAGSPRRLFGVGLMLLAWVVTRLALIDETFLGITPGDVELYRSWAESLIEGGSPAIDPAFTYPPGASGLMFVIFSIAPENFYRAFTLLALAADFTILIVLWLRSRSADTRVPMAPWSWIIMGFAAGSLMYQRFDIFAALLAVLAVLTVRRSVYTGFWAGLGFVLKLWPELALLGLRSRAMPKALIVNIATIAAFWISAQLIWGDAFGFAANALDKGLAVESMVAFPFLLARKAGAPYQVSDLEGLYAVLGPGTDLTATLATLAGLVSILFLFLLRFLQRIDLASPGDVVLLGLLIFIATNKFNSVQYGIWIAAITSAALSFKESRVRGPAILLTLMLLLTSQAVWPNFIPLTGGSPVFLAIHGLRLLLLLASLAWVVKIVVWDCRTSVRSSRLET